MHSNFVKALMVRIAWCLHSYSLLGDFSGFHWPQLYFLPLQVLTRLLEVCSAEQTPRTDDGLEALVFTAQGDMRQALNNLQSTYSGFGLVNSENVFKV